MRGLRLPARARALSSRPVRSPSASSLWRNGAFVRLWTASTVSVFGSLITRMAPPFVAILVLDAGAIEVAFLRSVDLAAALVCGLAAGAWADRLRRRPVLIWADLGRALLLLSVPVAAVTGLLSLPQRPARPLHGAPPAARAAAVVAVTWRDEPIGG